MRLTIITIALFVLGSCSSAAKGPSLSDMTGTDSPQYLPLDWVKAPADVVAPDVGGSDSETTLAPDSTDDVPAASGDANISDHQGLADSLTHDGTALDLLDQDATPGTGCPGYPKPEDCNGLDDDCDGQVDEGFGSMECGLGQCLHSVAMCNNGVPGMCDPFAGISFEVCDGLDNDCDGQIDEELNQADCGVPQIVSEPPTTLDLSDALGSEFELDEVFISSSRMDEVRVYDAETLEFLQAFTHPAFSEVNSPVYTYGPNGMAFNERRNLVVAAYSSFVEFSSYGIEYATYPKMTSEANENIMFDSAGNLYTTTATGGSDKLNQYSADNYEFLMTIDVPPGAGQLTGITFDNYSRLFVASQSGNAIHVLEFSNDYTTFEWVKAISGAGNPKSLEGLQISPNGEILAAAGDIIRYDYDTGQKIGSFDAPGDLFPVPLTVDNWGRIYTSDYENGGGTVSADIFRFSPEGELQVSVNDPGLLGPFGLAISGTVLPGDPPFLFSYQVVVKNLDGDKLQYFLVKGPPGMFVVPDTGLVQWYVTSAQFGQHEVAVKVQDAAGNFDIQEFVLEVK